jgi:hypothetical protein
MEEKNSGDCFMKMWAEEIATAILLFGFAWLGALFLIALV